MTTPNILRKLTGRRGPFDFWKYVPVVIVSGRTLREPQRKVLRSPRFEPSAERIYLFIDNAPHNIAACNRLLTALFKQAGVDHYTQPLFTRQGVAMLYLPEDAKFDYVLALMAHFLLINQEKFIAIRGVVPLIDRLKTIRGISDLVVQWQSLYALSYNTYFEKCLHDPENPVPRDYELALIPWQPVDLANRELLAVKKCCPYQP